MHATDDQQPRIEQWDCEPDLEGVVHLLSERTAGLVDANDPSDAPRRISSSGVGSNAAEAYVNEVFALRDFCWCEGSVHPEVVDWDSPDSEYLEMPPSGGTSSGCPPNFEHFASGIRGEWYKHLGRDVRFSRSARTDEALAVLMDCLRSMPGMGHLPEVKTSHRSAWGWTR